MKNKKFLLIFCLMVGIAMFLTGCGKDIEYKLEFMVDNSVYSTIDTSGKETISMPADPTKDGFIFDGWYWDNEVWQRPFTANSLLNEPLSSNMKVYAKWDDEDALQGTQAKFVEFTQVNETKYKTTVSNDTEILNFSNVVEVENKATWTLCTDIYATQNIPSKIATLNIGNNTYYILVTAENSSVKLYTIEIRRRPLYTVTFNSNGGSNVNNQIIEEDCFATLPIQPTRRGYTFDSWNFNFEKPITQATIINANWNANIYKVNYNANNGTEEKQVQDVTFNTNIRLYNNTTFDNQGYNLVKWNTRADGLGISYNCEHVINDYNNAGNLNLYAVWQPTVYAITYDLDNGINGDNPLKYNIETDTFTLKDASKTGYDFIGWYTESNFINKVEAIQAGTFGNKKLFAKWTASQYLITLNANGGTLEETTLQVTYDSPYVLPTPTRDNYYKFEGWFYNGNKITSEFWNINSNATIVAKWLGQLVVNGDGSVTGLTTYGNTLSNIKVPAYIDNAGIDDLAVTSISADVFKNKTIITSILLGPNLSLIEGSAFYGCANLTTVDFAENIQLTSIGRSAFYGCSNLTSINIPSSVKNIGRSAFYDCTNLVEINFNATNMNDLSSSNYVFYNVGISGAGITVNIGANVTKIPAYLFYPYSSYSPKITAVNFAENSVCTTIGNFAFRGCSGLTTITIPENVTSVGSSAFYGCSNLTSINIPSSVTTIGGSAFSGCTKLIEINFNATNMNNLSDNNRVFYNAGISGAGITVNIGANVTKIPAYLFYPYSSYSPKITEVNFAENSVCTTIGEHAFYNCTNLTSINIPSGVTSVGSSAFYGCSNLTSINIPSSVTTIGGSAFSGCTKLIEINFNATNMNNLSDNNRVFYNAGISGAGITVNIGANVTKIPAYLFDPYSSSYSPKITAVNFAENSVCTTIGNYAFYDCSNLTSINIPLSVTSVGNSAFSGCSGLTTITIPENVTSIGDSAFHYCTKLVEINFEEGIQLISIRDSAFRGCTSLTTITIPASATSIGDSAFYGCSSLTSINIPENVTNIGNYAFYDCTNLVEINFNATSINDLSDNNRVLSNAGISGAGITVNIGANVTKIPAYLLYPDPYSSSYLPKITAVNFAENSVCTTIGNSAFRGCSGLTIITIPENITSIGNSTFYGCSSLTSINIPASATSIGDSAFYGCSSLTSINIENVTSIGNYALNGCASLINIEVSETNLNYSSSNGVLFNKDKSSIIRYPSGKVEMFKRYTIPTSVTSIGDLAFSGCTNLRTITIPTSVTSIGNFAFRGCSGLTTITIPENVTSIGNYAFSSCTNLTSINIPAGVKSIGNYAFSSSSFLSSVSFTENSVCTTIGDYAFYDCSGLRTITIPASVTSIGDSAFRYCTNLTSINILASVTSIGDFAFSYCTNLTSVYLNSSILIDYSSYMLSGCSQLRYIYVPANLVNTYQSATGWISYSTRIFAI